MKDKTCKECWWFFRETGSCMHSFKPKHCSSTHSCDAFQPRKEVITNGDKIRQRNNRELAEIFDDLYNGNKCRYCINNISGNCMFEWIEEGDCISGFEAWLNAPAESEGEDEQAQ